MKKLIPLIALYSLTSCVNPVEKRGYSFDLSDYKLVKEGISSKETVLGFMGSPTLVSNLDSEELWVYFSEDVRKVMFFKPKILDRKIMTVSFDKTNIVKEVSNYGLKDQKEVNFVADYTEVKSHKKSFWSRIFKNVGQVNAGY
ncbi:MAG: outer membrane protein assembly factor BamE [Proteobacteria bacterium]|nr:outer membrane protein assembly factor BamE [Pseudomonadota bacterium]